MAKFRTQQGEEFTSATQRRYIVVDRNDGEIEFRTDSRDKAVKRAMGIRRLVVAERVTEETSTMNNDDERDEAEEAENATLAHDEPQYVGSLDAEVRQAVADVSPDHMPLSDAEPCGEFRQTLSAGWAGYCARCGWSIEFHGSVTQSEPSTPSADATLPAECGRNGCTLHAGHFGAHDDGTWGRSEPLNPYSARTDESLAHMLVSAATEPGSWSLSDRGLLMVEAARRLLGR